MTQETKTVKVSDILEAMRKRWYWVSLPLMFFLFFGAWLYVVLPRTYEASTLILVQPQEIPSAYVESTVSIGIEQRVGTLSQEVMSRSNLEKIIKEMDLFLESRAQGVSMDILVEAMRRKIQIHTSGSGRRGQVSSFTISYKGRDPQKTAEVTNRLSSFFIESNLRLQARQAAQATAFLKSQLSEIKGLLEEQESKVEAYRNKHMGELPEQLQSNISTISGLQIRLESVRQSMTDAINQRMMLSRTLSRIQGEDPGAGLSLKWQRIARLRDEIEEKRSTYTSEHPEIKRLEKQIADLEKQPEQRPTEAVNPQIRELRVQLSAVDVEIDGFKKEITRLKEKIEVYQRRVESTPKREQELAGLTRDYTITQQNYQRLLDRYYESKRAESMEKRQQGEQFRILDFAKPPQTPVSPDKTRIALVFLALGLGAGAGILFLFELADRSIKDSARLEVISGGIPCISSVPLALTQYDRKRLRWRNILLIVLNLAIFCLGVFLVIYSRMAHIVVDIPFPL